MAWERRRRGRFYYRARKVDGRTVKEYIGNGEVARIAAAIDAEGREKRAAEGAALQAQKARLEPVDRMMQELEAGCKLLMHAVLAAEAGYFQQNRREWRRRRVRPEKTPEATPAETA